LQLQFSTEGRAGLARNERALARLRAGQVLEERLGEPEGARRIYAEAAAIAPEYRPARDRLERVLHQLDDRPSLVEFYREEYELANAPARKTFLLGVLGQLASALDQPEDAIKYLGALLKQRPDHIPSLQRFARLLAHAGRMEDVLKVTEREITLTQGASRQAKLLHRAGEIALQLGDPQRARSNFERALVAADDHAASIGALDKLLRNDGGHAARLDSLHTLMGLLDAARLFGGSSAAAAPAPPRINAWPGWELSPEALSALVDDLRPSLPDAAAVALANDAAAATRRIPDPAAAPPTLPLPAALERSALERGVAPPDPASAGLWELAAGSPPGRHAWLAPRRAELAALARAAEEWAAASRLSDRATAERWAEHLRAASAELLRSLPPE